MQRMDKPVDWIPDEVWLGNEPEGISGYSVDGYPVIRWDCKYGGGYRRLNEEYEAFSKAAGLRPQYERGNIAEFGPKEAREAKKAANK